MADLFDPYCHLLQEHPDFDRDDERQAVEAVLLLNDLTLGYLEASTPLDTLLDGIAEHGTDPDEWIAGVEAGVERICGQHFVQNANGLFLPKG